MFRDVLDDDLLALAGYHRINLSQIKIILVRENVDIRLNARDINTLENVGAMLDHLHGLNVWICCFHRDPA